MSAIGAREREAIEDALARVAARVAAGPVVDDAATRQAVLEKRARILARPLVVHDDSLAEDELDILTFRVGDERLGIPLSAIVAIVRLSVVTPLPRAAAPVYGVSAWRGRPLTVLSVGGAGAVMDAEGRLIVLGDARRAVVGLLADAVDDSTVVRRSQLSPARDGARGVFAMGMTEDAVLVLDADAMLNAARPEPRRSVLPG